MTLDQYAVCPCGNGKKIKFCKCKDSLPELDRVMTMIEGGQIVPALDRLNQVLAEHPDAAWALAIKGRLMIDLREFDALAETADRFVRLQPSNPLALAQRAAAELFHEQFDKATLSLLEAITESGRSVDSFVLDVSVLLATALASEGSLFTARAYLQLPLTAQGYEPTPMAINAYRQLNSATDVNHLVKHIPPVMPRPDGVAWAERFDEAIGLLRSNQFLLAESKLQSLAKTVPREPCVLSGLFTCAVWRGDVTTQADSLRKLSECEQLDLEIRSKFLAQAWLTEPNQTAISVPSFALSAEVGSADESEMALSASSKVIPLSGEMLELVRSQIEEVPPRSIHQLVDREKPSDISNVSSISNDQWPICLATIHVYGKQTDRSAYVEAVNVQAQNVPRVKQLLSELLPGATWSEVPQGGVPFQVAMFPSLAMLTDIRNREEGQRQRSIVRDIALQNALNLPLPCLKQQTLSQSKDDQATQLTRTALARLIEGTETVWEENEQLPAQLRDAANVAAAPKLSVQTLAELGEIDPADMPFIDVAALNAPDLMGLFRESQVLGLFQLAERCAERIISMVGDEHVKPAVMAAYLMLVQRGEDYEQGSKLLDAAKAFGKANEYDLANIHLVELSYRLKAGDVQGFQSTLETISREYRNRPEVLGRVQQMLMQLGLIRPDGMGRSTAATVPGGALAGVGPSPASAPSSGIWTPGSSAPAPAASGQSKLWIPGMD